MVARVRIKWNRGAFAEIRTSPEVMAELNDLAAGIASRAGEGFVAKDAQATGGRVRGRAAVVTATAKAMADQARNHTIEASL